MSMRNNPNWGEVTEKLKAVIARSPLVEEQKWGKPCYTFQGSNILIIQAFKGYCALMFCKGALLKDAHGLLIAPGENTQAGRQMRFTSVQQVAEIEPVLTAYIDEALAAEKAGLTVSYKTIAEFAVPAEFQQKLDELPALKTAYEALTPGRRRGYLLHFSSAKQAGTRHARVEKCIPQILAGKGYQDR